MIPDILITERDELILNFLWRFKVATTATLVRRFFPNSQAPITGYKRLLHLKRHQFIQIRSDHKSEDFGWMLDVHGYKKIKNTVGEIAKPGYAPESVAHDLLVNAVLLGDWFMGFPQSVDVFTEQEMKRLHPSVYEDWVPKNLLRIPDGLWHVPKMDATATIALELELNQKSTERYQKIAQSYGVQEFYRVLWIANTEKLAVRIANTIQKTVPLKPFNHNFVTLPQFKKHGWLSPIILGPDKERTIAKLLGATQENTTELISNSFLLNGRKFPFKSKAFVENLAIAKSNL